MLRLKISRSEFDDLFMRKTYSLLMMSKYAEHDETGEHTQENVFDSLYHFITNHLEDSQHVWLLNKTRVAYDLNLKDLEPFLRFWMKRCDEAKEEHQNSCSCASLAKNRVVTYLNTLYINNTLTRNLVKK